MRAPGSFLSSPVADASPTSFWLLLLLLAMAVYAFGLGGQYVPTNGDELVYAHIARETAETGHWLPLASELADTRNTKPPLLFWQAMVAGGWGEHWTLAALRTPSLIYTLLLAAAVAWSVRLVMRRWHDGLIAACVYLAFLSTFRYGRPYLTSAPETFWLSLPLFALLWQRLRSPGQGPGWGAHTVLGLALGLGLAYKSFALIAPAAAAWWAALVLSEPRFSWRLLLRHSLRTAFSAALALGVFALWFVLDPDPQGVWQEFIVAENAAKFRDPRSWWQAAFAFDGSSIWSQLLAYAVNAGLLATAVLGLGWLGLKRLPALRRATLPAHTAILLAWSLVWLLVFLLPDQRSARYVIPAMPAVAMLLALHWRDIGRLWFTPSLLFSVLALLMIGRIAWVGHTLALTTTMDIGGLLLAIGLGALAIAAGLSRPSWTRATAVAAPLLIYAAFNLTVAPLDGPVGRYSSQTAEALPGGRIAVPNGFNSQFERFQFLLPGRHTFVPYETEGRAIGRLAPGASLQPPAQQLEQLLAAHDAVIWIQSSMEEDQPLCLPRCSVLGERWLLKSRHLPGEITTGNLWYPQQWLFKREWLLARPAPR